MLTRWGCDFSFSFSSNASRAKGSASIERAATTSAKTKSLCEEKRERADSETAIELMWVVMVRYSLWYNKRAGVATLAAARAADSGTTAPSNLAKP